MMGRNERGFSLLEVLVASAILAGVMTAAMGVYSGALSGTHKLASHDRAVDVALHELARATADEAQLAPGREQGVTPDGLEWQVTVFPFEGEIDTGRQANGEDPASEIQPPYEVVVTVSWQHKGRTQELVLRTLRARPET